MISKPSARGSSTATSRAKGNPTTATSKANGSSTINGDSTIYPNSTFVVVYKDEYQDEIPTIGKVEREMPGRSVEVEWWYGRYSTVCKRREGREYVPWTEVISKDDILMSVTFTKSNHIKQCCCFKAGVCPLHSPIDSLVFNFHKLH